MRSDIPTAFSFLPDFTEHPKPKKKRVERSPSPEKSPNKANDDDDDVTFFHDFCAGGVAGCASVIVGHPFDTLKVRLQTSTPGANAGGMLQMIRDFGGVSSLFRGMTAPLGAASFINAVVFGSYGFSSRLYDEHVTAATEYGDEDEVPTHDPWQKSWFCGSFAGAVQCLIICPMEHVKCRLQTQKAGATAPKFTGSVQTTQAIVSQYGVRRLYQGWWTTALREIPAFGLYFASYDYLKDQVNTYLTNRERQIHGDAAATKSSHAWFASAVAGGSAGCITWAMVYPVDVIKTRVQTAPLDTPLRELRMWSIAKAIAKEQGVRYLFRGLGITMIRAFPVNGTIFPVYEFTLKQISNLGY